MTVQTRESAVLPDAMTMVGGAGFLGRHFIHRLSQDPLTAGIRLTCLDRVALPNDLPKPLATRVIVGDVTPDRLDEALSGTSLVWIRAGALGGRTSGDVGRIQDYLDGNVDLVAMILDACDRHGCRRVVFDSSGGVFGDSCDRIRTTTDAEPTAANYYGATKLICEKLVRAWAHSGGSNRSAQVFRYSRVRDANTRDVIYHMVSAALQKNPIVVLGNTDHRISFAHAEDVTRANMVALSRCPQFALYHVATDRPISLFELAQRVREWAARRTQVIVPIHREPYDASHEAHVLGLEWEDSARLLGLGVPKSIDEMIEETMDVLSQPLRQ